MNYPLRTARPVPAIGLAGEADFSLGDLTIRPSVREVRIGERLETIEPRVMQVLVVLARAQGSVVSRDHLVERCWGGRIVGDDALNNCVAKVRTLATLSPQSAFEIETIPRVGYRLHARVAPGEVAAPRQGESASSSVRVRLPHSLLWLGAAVAALALAIAAMFWPRTGSGEWVIVESRQPFIATTQIARWPAFSPDGTIIAYSAGPDIASRKIFLRLRNGGDPIQLTHDAFDASSPAWSPDGSMIAFVLAQAGRPCRIMLIPVPAGASRQVGQCRTNERSAISWDRAGQALFFTDSAARDKPQRIWRLELQSGKTAEFIHVRSASDDDAPSLSPDGRTMLLIRTIGGAIGQIVLHPVSGGAERVLLQSNDDGNAAAWSSDSATVFATRENRWGSSLWAYPLKGARPWQITTSAVGMGRIASGPHGLLAIELESIESDLALASATAGQPPRIINQDVSDIQRISYAPDGTLAEIADQSGAMGMWLADPGKPFRPLLQIKTHSLGGFVGSMSWSPDGSRLAYTDLTPDGFMDRVIGRSGAPVAQFSVPALDVGWPDWSADGKSLQQARRDANGIRVWRTAIARPDLSVPVSPYGWVFLRKQGTATFGVKSDCIGVWRMDGKLTRVADGPHGWPWRIANDRIVYLDSSDPAHTRIMAVPISGGPAVALGYAPGIEANLAVAVDPRTGQVVYNHMKHEDFNIGWIRLERR